MCDQIDNLRLQQHFKYAETIDGSLEEILKHYSGYETDDLDIVSKHHTRLARNSTKEQMYHSRQSINSWKNAVKFSSSNSATERLCKAIIKRDDYNLFFRPNTLYTRLGAKHTKDSDVRHFRAFFLDLENIAPTEAVSKLKKAFGMPSLVTCSGNGVHAYYFLDQPLCRYVCKDLFKEFILEAERRIPSNSDKKTVDPVIYNPSRMMRLPGSINFKKNEAGEIIEKSTYIIASDPTRKFNLKALLPLSCHSRIEEAYRDNEKRLADQDRDHGLFQLKDHAKKAERNARHRVVGAVSAPRAAGMMIITKFAKHDHTTTSQPVSQADLESVKTFSSVPVRGFRRALPTSGRGNRRKAIYTILYNTKLDGLSLECAKSRYQSWHEDVYVNSGGCEEISLSLNEIDQLWEDFTVDVKRMKRYEHPAGDGKMEKSLRRLINYHYTLYKLHGDNYFIDFETVRKEIKCASKSTAHKYTQLAIKKGYINKVASGVNMKGSRIANTYTIPEKWRRDDVKEESVAPARVEERGTHKEEQPVEMPSMQEAADLEGWAIQLFLWMPELPGMHVHSGLQEEAPPDNGAGWGGG